MNFTAIGIFLIAFCIMVEIIFLRIIVILERVEAEMHQCRIILNDISWLKLNKEFKNQKD